MREKNTEKVDKLYIAIGRYNPYQNGHVYVAKQMIEAAGGIEKCLTLVGSCNAPLSIHNMFTYPERRSFIQTVFPGMSVAPLPDFSTNEEWFAALDDLLRLKVNDPMKDVVFFCGCTEDTLFLENTGRQRQIVNRFTGRGPRVSGSQVRELLIQKRSVRRLVNPLIYDNLMSIFAPRWEMLKRKA